MVVLSPQLMKQKTFSTDELFQVPNFDIFAEDSFVCYNNKNHCFYVDKEPLDEWWDSMVVKFKCPYCPAIVGAITKEDIPYSKHWMGKHLAIWHQHNVEEFLLQKEQKEEYHVPLY